MQQEIASLKADNSLLEEDIIKIIDEVEAAQEEVKKEKERLKSCEKDFGTKEQELAESEKKLNSDVEGLEKQRNEIIGQVDPETRDLYSRVSAKKQGRALARVVGDLCSACQIKLRPQILNEVMGGDRLVSCESCSRFLYIETDSASQDQPAS